MRKFLHIACVVTLLFSALTIMATNRIASFNQDAVKHLLSKDHQWKTASFKKPSHSTVAQYGTTLGPSSDYSFISGPDNSEWYATQQFSVEGSYYTASKITIYNNLGEQQGQFNVTMPDNGNCNQILVGEAVSTNLFDRDKTTYEIPVIFNVIIKPGEIVKVTHIYDLASGELKQTYDGFMSVYPYSTGYSTEWIGVRSYSSTENNVATTNYDIYMKPTYGNDQAVLKKTFSVPTTLAEYQIGRVLNIYVIDNSLYYVVSHYEKEYLAPESYQEPWDMIPTSDNNFIATIYNKNFTEIGSDTIPVTSTAQYLVQYGVGLFSNEDLSKNIWDNSDEFRLVVASSGFQVNTESENLSFSVYDMNSNVVKTIASNVGDWLKMYDIPGQPSQYAFLSSSGTTLSMVDIPSCEVVTTIGTTIGEYSTSTNIDRYPINDSYQYVMSVANATTGDNGEFIQRLLWINKDASVNHVVNFNLGTNNASWTPLVMGEAFNPYLFDTDDAHEYMFIANQYAEGATSGNITDQLRIVKEDGTEVRTYVEDPNGKGDIGSCMLLGLNSNTPTLVIPYRNSSTDSYTLDLEFLPFSMFNAGGDGSIQNPYLISSAGDMAMIARNPAAHYRIVNDFSAASYGAWTAIPSFTGALDGGNFTISDLTIDGDQASAAIFASAENAKISNFTLDNASIEIDQATTAAFVVAEALTDTISNITITNATITANDNAYATIGTVMGSAMFNSVIEGCYVSNLFIEAPSCSNIGGIVGDTRTGSSIAACAVDGKIKGSSTVGGIVGALGTDCSALNCHASVEINALNTIGGIAGTADRGGIHLCYVEGSLIATEADYNDYYSVGGITGNLAINWDSTIDTTLPWNGMVISNNVISLSEINTTGKGVHRVIGYSRWDDDIEASKWDSSIVPTAENAIANNYVVAGINAIDKSIEPNDSTTEGADVAVADLNKDFFANLGFVFGNDNANPWNTNSTNDPGLYFEQIEANGVDCVIKANPLNITITDGVIDVEGATSVEIYNVNGVKVATQAPAHLNAGIYIVVATDESGNRSVSKIMMK